MKSGDLNGLSICLDLKLPPSRHNGNAADGDAWLSSSETALPKRLNQLQRGGNTASHDNGTFPVGTR
jgi:hypothetical protein